MKSGSRRMFSGGGGVGPRQLPKDLQVGEGGLNLIKEALLTQDSAAACGVAHTHVKQTRAIERP